MPFTLNNQPSADDYTVATTLDSPGAVKVNLLIANAAVYVQMADPTGGVRGGNWRNEVFMAPGFHNLTRRTEGVRFRSAAAGVPARVTIEALTDSD